MPGCVPQNELCCPLSRVVLGKRPAQARPLRCTEAVPFPAHVFITSFEAEAGEGRKPGVRGLKGPEGSWPGPAPPAQDWSAAGRGMKAAPQQPVRTCYTSFALHLLALARVC